jgi:dienelactone hydrolase
VSPAGDVRPERVYALLAAEDARLERRILALAWRKRWPPPALAILERLLRGDDARVRTLAARLLPETEDASATRERAKADADPFVRAAVERREPPKEAMRSLASAVRAGQAPPEWPCGGDAGWASRATAAQRTRGQVPGATLRMMRTPPNEGLPYVAQVPDDYRGDEPYPLVIVLGGGAGVALEAAQRMDRAFDATGYVAVYPQAIGSWWDDASAQAVLALLREVLSDFNIDANRVYLTGVSNGGTGTFLYSTLWPDRLAAAAPLMGAGVLLLGSRLPSLEGVARLPLLFVHGTDDAVIPTAGSADTVKAIRRADPDARVEMHTLSGRGHDVHVGADGDLTLPFFARHVRDPFPRTVRWRGRTLAAARAFWVEVLEKDGGNASVDATIDGHTVTLETRHVRRLRLLLRRELLPPGPLRVTLGGRVVVDGAVKEDCGRLARTWAESGDPFLAHAWEIAVTVPKDAHASQQSPPSIPRTP